MVADEAAIGAALAGVSTSLAVCSAIGGSPRGAALSSAAAAKAGGLSARALATVVGTTGASASSTGRPLSGAFTGSLSTIANRCGALWVKASAAHCSMRFPTSPAGRSSAAKSRASRQRIGEGKVLPQRHAVLAEAKRAFHRADRRPNLTRQRQSEAEIRGGQLLRPISQQRCRLRLATAADQRQRQPQRGRGAAIAERYRIAQAGCSRQEPAGRQIACSKLGPQSRISRRGEHRSFRWSDRLLVNGSSLIRPGRCGEEARQGGAARQKCAGKRACHRDADAAAAVCGALHGAFNPFSSDCTRDAFPHSGAYRAPSRIAG